MTCCRSMLCKHSSYLLCVPSSVFMDLLELLCSVKEEKKRCVSAEHFTHSTPTRTFEKSALFALSSAAHSNSMLNPAASAAQTTSCVKAPWGRSCSAIRQKTREQLWISRHLRPLWSFPKVEDFSLQNVLKWTLVWWRQSQTGSSWARRLPPSFSLNIYGQSCHLHLCQAIRGSEKKECDPMVLLFKNEHGFAESHSKLKTGLDYREIIKSLYKSISFLPFFYVSAEMSLLPLASLC